MKKLGFILAPLVFTIHAYSQTTEKYIGGGNTTGVTVTASSESKLYDGIYQASAQNTINGSGMDAKRIEAARFLTQATFGATADLTEEVAEIGIEKWLKKQYALPPTYLSPTIQEIYLTIFQSHLDEGGDSIDFPVRANSSHLDYAWWENTIKGEDLLRQRMAYALSEILVISVESNLSGYGLSIATYYDILLRNAFGNYRDILEEVTYNPAMGVYLSHLNNNKTDTYNNTNPDENYAREIMQLFSIGLFELNPDGSRKLDEAGLPIPTYTNEDIKEFAKIFTGLGIGARLDGVEPSFWNSLYIADVTVPMIMHEDHHEPGIKNLLNGFTVPDGQTGDEDIAMALDLLFNHPNVGPFLASRLIKHFVKSNPTPSYVADITGVFNDNGEGERGDLGAVLNAILMHPEARECEWMTDISQGKLREPILRYTAVVRHFGGISPYEDHFWNHSYSYYNDVDQHPLHAPTVFNFYSPAYIPNGELSDAEMVGPEFEIHNSRTSINYGNWVYYWVEYEYLLACSSGDVPEGYDNVVQTNLSRLTEYAKDSDALLDQLDVFLCNGQLSAHTREIIKETLENYPPSALGITERIQLAVYLILISPDFTIQK